LRYQILLTSRLSTLVDLVNKYIDRGWKPCGGVATSQGTPINDDTTFYQAMTHKKLDPLEDEY